MARQLNEHSNATFNTTPPNTTEHNSLKSNSSTLLTTKKILKKYNLIRFANSIFHDKENSLELNLLLDTLGLQKEEVIQAYVDYDLDIFAFSNEIYDSLKIRFVMHMHNLLKGSWHQDRQKTTLEFIKKCNPKTVVGMGFGEPSLYVKNALSQKAPKITLCDYSDTAFIFAETLLKQWSSSWNQTISFKKLDMESGEYAGDFDAYIFQDSIEHVSTPTSFLKKYVRSSPKNANFIMSLPIGPIIPSHYIAWSTDQEAIDWLSFCGLKIQLSKKIYTNPKVDLFANEPDFNVYNLFALCSKAPQKETL